MTVGSARLLSRALAGRYPYRPEFLSSTVVHPALQHYRFMTPLRGEALRLDNAPLVLNMLSSLAEEQTWGLKVRHLEVVVEDDEIGIEFVADRYIPEH